MSASPQKVPRLPPRWFIRAAWKVHRAMYRSTGGRFGIWNPKPGGWGALQLTTTGRRSGESRSVMVGYFCDGPNLVTLAMNGWGAAEPAWWLNLTAHPDASVVSRSWRGPVVGRAAVGEERDRLWAKWVAIEAGLEGFAALRPRPTSVVVLEPQVRVASR